MISKCNQHNYFWKISALVLIIEWIKKHPAIPTEMYISEVGEIKKMLALSRFQYKFNLKFMKDQKFDLRE